CQTPFFRNGTGTAGDKGKPSLPPRSIPVSVSDGSRLVRLVDDVRLGLAGDDRVVDNNLGRVRHRRQIVHRVEQHALENSAQAPSTGLALHRLLRDRSQRVLAELELDALHLEELLILLRQRVLRLGQDLDERVLVELLERRDDGQAADELRNETVLDQVFRLDVLQHLADVAPRLFLALDLGDEADAALLRAVQDDLVEARERPAADEQDVRGIHLQELLLRMLAPALRRHRRDRALDQLQERLLHTFARDVARDRRVVALTRDLVDLVDVDDTRLRLLDVVLALLQQLLDDVLHILADVPGFGQRRRIRDRERHVQQTRERFREQRFSAPRGTDQQDVALRELDVLLALVALPGLEALVVVVHRDGEHFLRRLLADDVLVENRLDLVRLRKLVAAALGFLVELLTNDVVAELYALVADEYGRPGDELAHFMLALAAERAVQQLAVVRLAARIIAHSAFLCSSEKCLPAL